MSVTIPPLTMIVSRLEKLSQKEVRRLADDSGVPFGTLMNIRQGSTRNPGIETVRAFFPLLVVVEGAQQDKGGDQ
jgi:transcriptional regulator with XRE-family HTH domain